MGRIYLLQSLSIASAFSRTASLAKINRGIRAMRKRHGIFATLVASAAWLAASSPAEASGVWKPLTNQPSFVPDTPFLLTDGTVMVHVQYSTAWWRLSPDQTGSYLNGTWSLAASLPSGYSPTYFASAVLPDGRLIIEGGEYVAGVVANSTAGALYDPFRDTWTPVAPPVGWTQIGDAPSVVLPNGTFMMGYIDAYSHVQALFNPASQTWTSAGTPKQVCSDEEGWTLLPNGNVLTIDIWAPPIVEIYYPLFGGWGYGNGTGTSLPGFNEIGPAMLRPDGSVFAVGGATNTAVFRPDGTWAPGPSIPAAPEGQLNGSDGPAALLPNGHVLFTAEAQGVKPGVRFFEFDGTSLTDVGRAGNASTGYSFNERFLLLPTGEILVTDTTKIVQIFAANGSADPGWVPTISSVPAVMTLGTTSKIAGTQFNGLSQAVSYGDDAQAATNYPLVRITNVANGRVMYARTHDHSTMGVATGSMLVSTYADIPAGMSTGPSVVQVVANGIASSGQSTCIALDGDSACANLCSGAVSDACGGTITCPRLSGRACCGHLGGSWIGGRCVLS
jgi:hypothetical protein